MRTPVGRWWPRWTLAALLCALAAAVPARSATIEVRLQDSDGQRISDLTIALYKLPSGGPPSDPAAFAAGNRPAFYVRAAPSGDTVIERVPVGSYLLDILGSPDKTLLLPSQNPFSPPITFTVSKEDERIALPVTLTRGDPVVCRLDINRGKMPRQPIHFLEHATGVRIEARLQDNGYAERTLPPGRWEVGMDPPPGFLFVSLELDREPLTTSTAHFEVVQGSRSHFVTWTFSALCSVSGNVGWSPGSDFLGNIEATLIQAGPWKEAANARGGVQLDKVPAHWDGPTRYEILLPDGRWRIAAVGSDILSSSPENAQFDLAPGDDVTADFNVVQKDLDESTKDKRAIVVQVVSPDGIPLKDARVTLWPISESGASAKQPLQSVLTEGDYDPRARFPRVPEGRYRVAAGHLLFTEVEADIPEETGPYRFARVTLGRGASIFGKAVDEKGVPVQGAVLRIRRTGPPLKSRLEDPALLRKRADRHAPTDATGRVRAEGLDAGEFVLTASPPREKAATHLIRIARGSESPAESLKLSLAQDERSEIAITLIPAAAVTGRIACRDSSALPDRATLALIDSVARSDADRTAETHDDSGERAARTDASSTPGAPAPRSAGTAAKDSPAGSRTQGAGSGGRGSPAGSRTAGGGTGGRDPSKADGSEHTGATPPPDRSIDADAVLTLNGFILTGNDHDRFTVGPVPGGAYVLAVRPETFNRWTFAPASEDRSRAVPLALEEGPPSDLGTIEIDCGPTIALEPQPPSGAALPDLRDAALAVQVFAEPSAKAPSAEGTPAGTEPGGTGPAGARPRPPAGSAADGGAQTRTASAERRELLFRPEPAEARIVLRDLPPEPVSVSGTLSHPFFVPETVAFKAGPLRLERGREASVPVPVPAIGGAIEILWERAKAAEVRGPAGLPATPGADPPARAAVPDADGKIRVGGLLAGTYGVLLFEDEARTHLLHRWESVKVAPLVRTRLNAP